MTELDSDMEITLTTKDGKPVLEVVYDPTRLTWDEAISAGIAAYGIKSFQPVTVIARPETATDTTPRKERWLNG
jgi:hypothetical protein